VDLQLGIGSIGTLISHHLRLALPSSPISLIVKNAHRFPSTRIYPHGKPGDPPISLSVERDGQVATSDGYELEIWHDGRAERFLRAQRIEMEEEEETPPNGPIDSLIVCLKTSGTMAALQTLRNRLSPSSVITLIHNGMGVYDELCSSLWPDPRTRPFFIIGTTTHGATIGREGGSVSHKSKPGEGDFKFGVVPDPRKEMDMEAWLWGRSTSTAPILATPPSPSLPLSLIPNCSTDHQNLSDTITALMSVTQLSPSFLPMAHLHHQLLLKLAVNSVINPLTAVLGAGSLPNGALFGSDPSHRLIRDLAKESSDVLTAYLHSLSAPHSPPFDVIRLFSWEGIERRVIALIKATSENTSSMAADVSKGRTTEIEHITGYIIALAKRLGVDAPCHKMIRQMVKFTAEVNGLKMGLIPGITTLIKDRRSDIENKRSKGRQLSPRELSIKEKELELEERRLWLAEEQVLETKRVRRRIRTTTEKMEDAQGRLIRKEFMADPTGKPTPPPARKPTREEERNRIYVESLPLEPLASDLRSAHQAMAAEAEASRPRESESAATTITPAPDASRYIVSPSPPSMDALISAVPRNAPQQEHSAFSSWASPGQADSTDATPLTSPRIEYPSPPPPPSPPADSIDPLPSGLKPESSIFDRYRNRFPRGGFSSSMDQLIINAPRVDRVWDLAGDHILPSLSPGIRLVDQIVARVSEDMSRGGLGTTLDGLIAGAPRQERVWPLDEGVRTGEEKRVIKGRFITSRTSGS